MSHTYALLVLADPPQSTHWEDLQLAFLPTVNAVIERLAQSSSASSSTEGIHLDIALPITRVVKEASSQTELRITINQLLAGIYQLLSVSSQRHLLSSNHRHHIYPDTTIVLIYEKPDPDQNDTTTVKAYSSTIPLAFRELEEFARSSRPWSRLFQVDSPGGDRIYQRLRSVTKSSILTVLHESVERLPAGIQLYIPPSITQLDQSTLTPDSDYMTAIHQQIIISVDNGALKVADKVKLTMALMSSTRGKIDAAPPIGQEAGSLALVAQGEAHAESTVIEFLEGLLGIEVRGSSLQGGYWNQPWGRYLDDGTFLSVSTSPHTAPNYPVAQGNGGKVVVVEKRVLSPSELGT